MPNTALFRFVTDKGEPVLPAGHDQPPVEMDRMPGHGEVVEVGDLALKVLPLPLKQKQERVWDGLGPCMRFVTTLTAERLEQAAAKPQPPAAPPAVPVDSAAATASGPTVEEATAAHFKGKPKRRK